MWGRVIVGAVIILLVIVWLAAIWLFFMDPRAFLSIWRECPLSGVKRTSITIAH
jgi:hypothetical protein